MISFIKTIIYYPLYNLLIFMLNAPLVDAGVAVILLTLLVKVILFPFAKGASVAQIKMREKEPELNAIKEKYKDKQEQAVKVMEFYKTNNINPFSGILTLFIQIPVIYSLYHIFLKSGLPKVDSEVLYSFIKIPENISMNFLGIFDISQKSIILAFLAAATTFLQMHFSQPQSQTKSQTENLSSMMLKQMKYTFPFIVFFISWSISGVVALYWFVSNLLSIGQDYLIKRNLSKEKQQ